MCECVFVCVFEMMTEKEVLLRAVVVFFIFFQVTHYVCKSLYSVHQKTYFEVVVKFYTFFFFLKETFYAFFSLSLSVLYTSLHM